MATSEPDTDAAIVSRIIRGDIDAYALLMNRYEVKLQRYVTYLIHDSASARDIVQDTFIKAYQHLRGYNPKYKFSSWIYRIAHNEAMNTVKKLRHLTDTDIDTLPEIQYDQKVSDSIDAEMLKTDVHACVAQLEPKYRDVVQLVYFEQLKYDEVSDVLQIPASTVGVWLSRAKKKLKEICQQKGVRR